MRGSRRWLALLGCLVCIAGSLMGCATAARVAPAAPSVAIDAGPASRLGQSAAAALADAGPAESALHLLPNGLDALAARLALIDRAERSVDLQYYIFRPDISGQGLAAALWQAAERGVRVRLLLDDWGARPDDAALRRLAAHPAIEVRLFNPLAHPRAPLMSLLLDFDRANRRMHNKLLLADGQAAIVGGRNVGDEYFARRREFEFADVDVLAFGPVVPELAEGFDRYWNDPLTAEIDPGPREPENGPGPPVAALWKAAQDSGLAARLDAGTLRRFVGSTTAVQDPPGKLDPGRDETTIDLGMEIARVMGDVREDLLIVSPYFVPGAGGVEQLQALTRRGVRVRIVTNSLAATDVPAVHGGYARYRKALLSAGVELFEIRADAVPAGGHRGRPGSSRLSLHAKVMVVDRTRTFIGSMNIDPRSVRLNTENGVVVDSAPLALEIADGVGRALTSDAWRVHLEDQALRWSGARDGQTVTLLDEPQAGLWLRLQATVLSWLPIEPLL